jgi:hypothetical protein
MPDFTMSDFTTSASLAALLIPLGLGLALPASAQQASVDREVLPIAQPPSAGIVNRTLAGSGREICDSSSIGLNSQTRQQYRSFPKAARSHQRPGLESSAASYRTKSTSPPNDGRVRLANAVCRPWRHGFFSHIRSKAGRVL